MSTTPPNVRQISSHQLKMMMHSDPPLELWDVRTDSERGIARIEGAKHLDAKGAEYIDKLDRDTPLVFHCHHGMRSQAAAQKFLALGFTDVCNLVGGIEAWSVEVDPAVPRY